MDAQHLRRGVAVEFAMEPENEIDGSRLRQAIFQRHRIDFGLHAHMGGGLDLQVAPRLVVVEIAVDGARDIARPGVMAFDQVAVVGVHDPHEASEIGGSLRIERVAKLRGGR